jgi:enoyl-CoA hydratase
LAGPPAPNDRTFVTMEKKSRPSIGISTDERKGSGIVARILIDNPARLNVLDSFLIQGLSSAIGSLQSDDGIRVLVLTGAGERAFVGGADMNEMASLDGDSATAFISSLHRACSAIRQFPVPVIARIRGYCLGAGLEIAASCDLRIASEDSVFGMPEVRVGIPSVIEAALLPNLIGWGRTRELVFTGKLISAQEALQWGLVERLVPVADLDNGVDQWVESILQSGPQAIRIQKALISKWESSSMEEAIKSGIQAFAEAYKGDEPRKLMGEFLKKSERRKTHGKRGEKTE